MLLFEANVKGYHWWVVAEDESDVFSHLRDDFYVRELSEEEIDEALEDTQIRKLTKRQAMHIHIVDEFGDKLYSVWSLFESSGGVPGVLASDFKNNQQLDEEDLEDLRFDW